MNPGAWWRWWRTLPQNPVYLREKGSWGRPNPFYDKLSRYSPFIILGTILLGLCTGVSNPALLSGSGDDSVFVFLCLLCLPGALLSMLTIFGSLMAPALTAPSISMERDRGTWDILRLTPQSISSILMAKLFGGLSRLRIWPALLVLSLFQGLMMLCLLSLMDEQVGIALVAIGVTTIIRPWLEILFAAFTGMYISTLVRSATMALAGSYTGIVFFKLFNNSAAWTLVASFLDGSDTILVVSSTVGPTAVYALAIILLGLGIMYQARQMNYS